MQVTYVHGPLSHTRAHTQTMNYLTCRMQWPMLVCVHPHVFASHKPFSLRFDKWMAANPSGGPLVVSLGFSNLRELLREPHLGKHTPRVVHTILVVYATSRRWSLMTDPFPVRPVCATPQTGNGNGESCIKGGGGW